MATVITYSPAVTLVPTYECFNACTYCNFRVAPGTGTWLSLDQARQRLDHLRRHHPEVTEILLLSGEVHPRSPERTRWVEHLYQLAKLAWEHGFWPHTNCGPLSEPEMRRLQAVNVSMGLMLEQLRADLAVHRHAPSKDPALRLAQLEQAGRLGIPFTTGLLLGIGETPQDWEATLQAIADVHRRWGHIQEVILQPYRRGSRQPTPLPDFPLARLPAVVALAREILPDDITIQVPPNLITQPAVLLDCLAAGARDLGGLGPRDEVNPDYAYPSLATLETLLAPHGYRLQPRLPIYPKWLHSQRVWPRSSQSPQFGVRY
ncbi:MAG: 7,8-didemethyl-8-hydroxy-5-deazariboflavin synthase subunit CofG [Gloeomargarita sp. SKYBB_i_bin120]|nr:7,8-didemethyl-8-hydroxy-5-deazariboflavin synthase subunit CofG [Gloeomargarita sp. SKYG98]MCS7292004.1 7,8-didemethyl-8-hydroxy-5-deazariboflavin synthase subunit CofG [Gloeomargarita sp. SKYB120]MDW8177564.1 7,8-didemethyl-8-hydroxy-5-deazariboflavin synthase subunit CofG [Gloeomargarita sp. SKYBB_i_bin120]